jgi:hypothetical protein
MSVPLDRLYHFIDNIACHSYDGRVIIYRFWPHGSKNIDQLCELYQVESYFAYLTRPMIYCHDQEALDYDRLNQQQENEEVFTHVLKELMNKLGLTRPSFNINFRKNLFGKSLLLHSERRSKNLEKYLQPSTNHQSQLLSVYYWSHALIARDWFRYAQHEVFKKNSKKKFLIYNRAWTGTREYRLKFTDLLITHQLVDQCLTHCNPVDPDTATGVHYSAHNFHNPVWQPDHVLENYVPKTTALSTASADFDSEDYNCTEIEVVLETLFDDDRLHLTEKSLRPIACGQPFILAATHGSLQYLKEYGFKTFDSIWDESYDSIEDPYDRMLAIIQLMKTINSWSTEEKSSKMQQIEQIVLHNQTYFFSENFFNFLVDELKQNFDCAFDTLKKYPDFEKEMNRFAELQKMPELQDYWLTNNMPDIMRKFIDNFHKK